MIPPATLTRIALFATALLNASHQACAAGATTPFTTLEAENGTLAGGALAHSFVHGSPIPSVATKELEASGAAYVELKDTGQSVSWSNPVAGANAIVIRSCLPDPPKGGGITATLHLFVNGKLRQTITFSSTQSWVYRKSSTNWDDPGGGGMPYHFYNEDRAPITGAPIPARATITLQKERGDSAEYYLIDCIDLESVPRPVSRPDNSLSIADYGADSTFTKDSTAAIEKCIKDARTQGKTVWIPPGKFMTHSLVSGPLDLSGVTVAGAGMWHSMIYRKVALPSPENWRSYLKVGTNTTVRDLSLDSNSRYRSRVGGADYGFASTGRHWLIERVWVQHCDANWLSGSDGIIRNSRVSDSWADGINLNNGNTYDPDKAGMNLTAENNFVRGCGDDGLATFSDRGEKGKNSQMEGTKIINNTSVAPWWANCLRVAGGKNVLVQNNLLTDAASNYCMDISVFGPTSQPLESAIVTGNVMLRGAGWNGGDRHGVNFGSRSDLGSKVTFSDNFIGDSRKAGMKFSGPILDLNLAGNVISNPAKVALEIPKGVTGSATLQNNSVRNLAAGQTAVVNHSENTLSLTMDRNSWQRSDAGPKVSSGNAGVR